MVRRGNDRVDLKRCSTLCSNRQPKMKTHGNAMKFFVNHLFTALLIFALAGVVA